MVVPVVITCWRVLKDRLSGRHFFPESTSARILNLTIFSFSHETQLLKMYLSAVVSHNFLPNPSCFLGRKECVLGSDGSLVICGDYIANTALKRGHSALEDWEWCI